MVWDEDFDRWFRRRRIHPRFNFEDMDKMVDEMFREMFENIPKDL